MRKLIMLFISSPELSTLFASLIRSPAFVTPDSTRPNGQVTSSPQLGLDGIRSNRFAD
jgi:hypothetical protein